uniref:Uncharacterized protein n=1 Tax=Ralstonia solanacearum TaxID=305 RepID=A0A0S4TRN3_RALSL|nr:protein of unknown function [Ralstonia solanacearum]
MRSAARLLQSFNRCCAKISNLYGLETGICAVSRTRWREWVVGELAAGRARPFGVIGTGL